MARTIPLPGGQKLKLGDDEQYHQTPDGKHHGVKRRGDGNYDYTPLGQGAKIKFGVTTMISAAELSRILGLPRAERAAKAAAPARPKPKKPRKAKKAAAPKPPKPAKPKKAKPAKPKKPPKPKKAKATVSTPIGGGEKKVRFANAAGRKRKGQRSPAQKANDKRLGELAKARAQAKKASGQ